MERAVQRGLDARQLQGLRRVGLDEKSFGLGQDYVSVLSDLDQSRVLEVVPGNDKQSGCALWQGVPPAQRQNIEATAMDMSAGFAAATAQEAPQVVMVHDKFHVAKMLNEAVDRVRRREHKELLKQNDQRLTGSRQRGLVVSYPLRDSIAQILRNRPNPEVDVIVITDGERILGLGDQGMGGLGIPIGKLSLYTLIGGIHPSRTLPFVLDAGTNNQERLNDPEYLGWRHERVRGQEYLDFVDRFVQAVKQELPDACLQWEDFATPNARPLLVRYQNDLLTFNDDVQGTAAVVLGAVVGASKVAGKSIKEHQLVFVGAGSAAIGVADYLRVAMVEEGLSEQEALARFWIVDKDGLIDSDRRDLSDEQKIYARSPEEISNWPRNQKGQIGLAEVISEVDATALIGLSTVKGIFNEQIIREMAKKTDRPIIFPLSNPTSHSEAEPSDLITWTEGRALVATGSPFAPVKYDGKTIEIAQCNNVFIFPAVGLGD